MVFRRKGKGRFHSRYELKCDNTGTIRDCKLSFLLKAFLSNSRHYLNFIQGSNWSDYISKSEAL